MTINPWLLLAFVFIAGLCVGSFLNVVILRLPQGLSLVTPPSRDPVTGDRLKWWENIPVLSWLALRGKSRYSGNRISVQYPLVELFTGLAFVGMYLAYYFTNWRPAFSQPGFELTWAVLGVHLTLLACLIASTVIDGKLFIIPLQIPWTTTAVTLIALPLAALLGGLPTDHPLLNQLVPVATLPGLGAAAGGVAGLVVSLGLMWAGLIPRSFDEPEDAQAHEHAADSPVSPELEADPEAFLAHPHPRREVMKELLFVGFPLLGMLIGMIVAASYGSPQTVLPPALRVLSGVLCGYLVGGGLVWLTRILGTLGFGKEAMGLGDVHLLAAIGAVVGPFDAALVFFIAPFMGLAAAGVIAVIAAVDRNKVRVIPYGPYLAAAAVLMMVARTPILSLLTELGILSPGMTGM